MKIIEQNSSKLKLRESGGCIWVLGFFSFAVAGTFVAGLSELFTNLLELSELEKLGGWIVSLSGVVAGILVIYSHPGVYVSFDKNTRTAIIHRRGLLKNKTETYKPNEIKDIVLDKTIDSEGDPFYRIA